MKKVIGFAGIAIGILLIMTSFIPIAISCKGATETAYADIEKIDEPDVSGNQDVSYQWNIANYYIRNNVSNTGYQVIMYFRNDRTYNNGEILESKNYFVIENMTTGTLIDFFPLDIATGDWYNSQDGRWRIYLNQMSDTFFIPNTYNQYRFSSYTWVAQNTWRCYISNANENDIYQFNIGFNATDGWSIQNQYAAVNNTVQPYLWFQELKPREQLGPLGMLKAEVNDFLNIPILGPQLTFGTILKLGMGIMLIGVCVKLFLGG